MITFRENGVTLPEPSDCEIEKKELVKLWEYNGDRTLKNGIF